MKCYCNPLFLSICLVLSLTCIKANSEETPGILHAAFIANADLDSSLLTKDTDCKTLPKGRDVDSIVVDIVVGLAGKITESLIDQVAAKTRAEITSLETITPIDGFYNVNGVEVENGCLVIHNGEVSDARGATIKALFRLKVSPDSTAFRFDVVDWKFTRFLKPKTSRWFQNSQNRDFALKIEFLIPGTESLGTRANFIEFKFDNVSEANLAQAFKPKQKLHWFASPAHPEISEKATTLPLNIKVTVVETTKPNQFADWLNEIAKDKKSDISRLVQESVRKSLDEQHAANQEAIAAKNAGDAYDAYKTAWDTYASHVALKPTDPNDSAYNADLIAWTAKLGVTKKLLESKKISAKVAYSKASISWPGNLPLIEDD